MWSLWLACSFRVPTDWTRIDPVEAPTTTSGATSTSPETLPEGWSRVRVEREGLGAIVSDGVGTWAIGGGGGVLEVGDPWLDLGTEPFPRHSLYAADAKDGILWALTFYDLLWLDVASGQTSWEIIPLPEELQGPTAVVARLDGTIAVLTTDQPAVDCYYLCPPSTTNLLGLWDGAGWDLYTSEPSEALLAMAETASGEIVAVGEGGWVAHWDGSAWLQVYGSGPYLRAVTTHGDEIVAVGDEGQVLRGTLAGMSATTVGTSDGLSAVAVSEDGVVWALSYGSFYVEDGGWTEVELPEDGWWSSLHATADGALLAGDRAGPTALALDSTSWSEIWREPSLYRVQGVWLEDDDTTWLAARSGVGRWDGETFETWAMPAPWPNSPGEIRALSGTGPDDVVGVGQHGVFEWNGAGFDLVYPLDEVLWDVSVAPDGTAFVGTSQDLYGVQVPQMLRRDAGVWSVDPAPIPTPARVLIALEAFAADDVYALTWSSPVVLLHFDGTSWTEFTGDLGEGYEALWGRSGTDLYLGKGGNDPGDRLMRWDGATMTSVDGAPPYVTSLAGTDGDLLVGGTSGWGDEYAPLAWTLRGGTWTEMVDAETAVVVGARGEVAVLAGWREALRGPLSSW
jgi:hypothetical protein